MFQLTVFCKLKPNSLITVENYPILFYLIIQQGIRLSFVGDDDNVWRVVFSLLGYRVELTGNFKIINIGGSSRNG